MESRNAMYQYEEALRKLVQELVKEELHKILRTQLSIPSEEAPVSSEEAPVSSEETPVSSKETPVSSNLEEIVTQFLHELGMPTHIRGYNYLRCGIVAAIEDTEMLSSVTKIFYPFIAKKYHTAPSRVERAIRHAIEVTWSRGRNIDNIYKIFGYTIDGRRGKPTNSEFIAFIVDKIRISYPQFRQK